MADASWIEDWESKDAEVLTAQALVAAQDSPRIWPISGSATDWNPDGFPLSKKIPADPFASSGEVIDDTTKPIPKR
jgi:hypothetical protein